MSENASTGTETGGGTPSTQTEITTVEQLPEFAQNHIRDLRAEAARHRTAKNDAVQQAKLEAQTEFETKLAESNTAHEAIKGQLAQATLSLEKLKAAIEAGIPVDKLTSFASRLQGNTPEELKADAVEVKKIFGVTNSNTASDPSQGMGGSGSSVGDDDFASFILSKLDR